MPVKTLEFVKAFAQRSAETAEHASWWLPRDDMMPVVWAIVWLVLTLGISASLALSGWRKTAIAIALLIAPLAGIAAALA
ncbi:MAG: hypothetical protein IAG10_13200 [Planctomycetaceae bacterium]|nr:hypothetical protein [Planctomycetaceae bacterium]